MLFGRYDLEDQYAMYLLCLAVLATWIVVAVGLRKARTGRALMATRDNERAAAAAGISPARTKLSGFLLAGTIAGRRRSPARAAAPQPQPRQLPGQRQHHRVLDRGHRRPGVGGGRRHRACCSTSYLETVKALGDLRLILTGAGLLFVLYALPGGLGQLLRRLRDRLLAVVAAAAASSWWRPWPTAPWRAPGATAASSRRRRRGRPSPPARHQPAARSCLLQRRPGYGSLQVVFDLDFEVHRGEIVALLGTNGAGKSTLLKGISGLLPPGAGTVTLGGRTISGEPADRSPGAAWPSSPGGTSVFPTLTVAENLRLAAWMFRKDPAACRRPRSEMLDLFPVLAHRLGQRAGDLSGGEQQMLGLAGSLMMEPDVLLIDELSLGLAPAVVAELLDVVRAVHARGTTVVVVEQSVNVALELAARAVFMEKGHPLRGPHRRAARRPDLLRSVFIEGGAGRPAAARRPAAATAGRAAGRRAGWCAPGSASGSVG